MIRPLRTAGAAVLLVLSSMATTMHAHGQSPGARPIVAASGRASTAVSFDGRLIGTIWLNRSTSHSGPAWMTIDYGQPHARGREIFGGLVPYGEVWRLGANMATHLHLDLNVAIGDLELPAGIYTLYLLPRPDGAELIVSSQTRQWGTEYDASADVGRVPLRVRTLPEVEQSLVISLEPDFPQPEGTLPEGVLRIRWGTVEYSADWRVTWP